MIAINFSVILWCFVMLLIVTCCVPVIAQIKVREFSDFQMSICGSDVDVWLRNQINTYCIYPKIPGYPMRSRTFLNARKVLIDLQQKSRVPRFTLGILFNELNYALFMRILIDNELEIDDSDEAGYFLCLEPQMVEKYLFVDCFILNDINSL